MSFDRLSSLESQPTTTLSTDYSDDPEFAQLTNQLSAQLVTLISNINQLNRQLALVGTKKDSETVRGWVKRLTDETRAGFKSISDGVKRVQNWEDVSPSMKYKQDKLQKQLASALTDFQAAQRLSAEKTRQYVSAARKAQHEINDGGKLLDELETIPYQDGDEGRSDGHQRQVPLVQQQAALAVQGDVDFQESLIVAREEEMQGIEQGITEINNIFKDLGALVRQQGDTLDMIDGNVTLAAQDIRTSDQELQSASRYQKGARNRACCLLLILAVVLAVVLLAVFV